MRRKTTTSYDGSVGTDTSKDTYDGNKEQRSLKVLGWSLACSFFIFIAASSANFEGNPYNVLRKSFEAPMDPMDYPGISQPAPQLRGEPDVPSEGKALAAHQRINPHVGELWTFQEAPPPIVLPEPPVHAPPAKSTWIVMCNTTKGPLHIAVYDAWSPRGTERFLDLVRSRFFHSKVALFRCVRNWITQFGISGSPALTREWRLRGDLLDDPQWLPKEDKHRFKRGMLSFAGGGKNTRGTEMFFANADVGLGQAPHEVPFGWLITEESFRTLDSWYQGYGELQAFGGHAPAQGKMYNRGLEYTEAEFPQLDYITGCDVIWERHDKDTPVPESDPVEKGKVIPSPGSIAVLLISSPVNARGRPDRLKAISQSWGLALRKTPDMYLRVLPSALEGSDEGKFLEEGELLPLAKGNHVPGDNAWRIFYALNAVYDQGVEWIFLANDHTFIIPENLRCFVDKQPLGSLQDDSWFGHRLKEPTQNSVEGVEFLSSAAGWLINRKLLNKLLKAFHEGTCGGSLQERSQPSLLIARCVRDYLHVQPREILDENGKQQTNVYGPLRLITGDFDFWWKAYRSNVGGVTDCIGVECCSKNTISFHYTFGPEQRLIDDVLRNPSRYREMDDNGRKRVWPNDRELGGYSTGPKDKAARTVLWKLLLEHLHIGEC